MDLTNILVVYQLDVSMPIRYVVEYCLLECNQFELTDNRYEQHAMFYEYQPFSSSQKLLRHINET